jgi:putative transposase
MPVTNLNSDRITPHSSWRRRSDGLVYPGSGIFHLVTIVRIGRLSEQEKDPEILILRQQLAILRRKQEKPVKPNRAEKMMLVVLTAKLKDVVHRPVGKLNSILRIFQLETVLGWHRELVRREWSYARKNRGGRLHIDQELEGLILGLAWENPRWGYGKI